MTQHAYICDALRTPFGRYGGSLSSVRADDLGAVPLKALMARHPQLDWEAFGDIIYGCANQAGEDNRNVARMSALLAGLPIALPGSTVNRLCGSGMDAVGTAARAIKAGEAELVLAGGVESMSRAPFVMPKATSAFARENAVYDTTIGWRFVNPLMKQLHGVDSMPETAENVASDFGISREDQDKMALASQAKAAAAQQSGFFDAEITPVTLAQKKGDAIVVSRDEHPRETTLDALAKLRPVVRADGTVTAGNASPLTDGATVSLLASADAAKELGLTTKMRLVSFAFAGVEPEVMGIGPIPSTEKALKKAGLTIEDIGLFELNEAFAVQVLSLLDHFGIDDEDPRVNAWGGAIAIGHPLASSGVRLMIQLARQFEQHPEVRYGLTAMCVGLGQGGSMIWENPHYRGGRKGK